MPEELTELEEQAEHAKEKPELAPVSLTMAVLAVLVAVATLLGHRAHTEEVVLQAKASDQWAFYQSQNVRRHVDELFLDLTSVQGTTSLAGRSRQTPLITWVYCSAMASVCWVGMETTRS